MKRKLKIKRGISQKVQKYFHTIPEYNPLVVTILILLIIIIVCLSVSMYSLYDSLSIRDSQVESLVDRLEQQNESNMESIESQLSEYGDDIDDAVERIDEAEFNMSSQSEDIAAIQKKQEELAATLSPTPAPTKTPATASSGSRRYSVNVRLSQADIRNIAALVYLEAGSQSYKCQKAIASVIINRMKRYNKTASQVIWEPGVFSPANRVKSTRPSDQCVKAVKDVINDGTTLPKNVVAFRNGHYHSFGKQYCCIDGVYFTSM